MPKARLMWTVVAALALLLGACGTKAPNATTLSLEPVTSMGANPFTPSVGNGEAIAAVPRAGGTVASNTAGLFGGTRQLASCDSAKMVAFLQAHPDKAAAWAGVLGLRPADIPAFVSTLTSVVLRSDTAVINHGFVNGRATAFAAVLQAGTAVLVDRHGNPVTRCACGNPLTAPGAFTKVRFVGPTWVNFSATSITVIQSVTVVVNNFTLVEPRTGASFQRPAGTQGGHDGPLTPPATTTPPPATTTPPPATTAPAPAPPTSASPPPTTAPPTTTPPAPPTTTPPAPPTTTPAPTTTPPAPTTTPPAPPSSAPPVPPPAPRTTGPQSSSSSPPPLTASWSIGTCFVDRRTTPPTFTGTVDVRNDDPSGRHSYRVTVTFGTAAPPLTATVSLPGVAPGETARADVSVPGTEDVTEPTVPCEITRLVDESGAVPVEGQPIPPPPDKPPPDQPPLTTPPAPQPPATPPTVEPS